MLDNKNAEFLEYLDLSINASQNITVKLINDNRNDEANHEKVKTNVYQIFKTVFQTITKQKTLEQEDIKKLFLEKTETIPANWKTSLESAKTFQDVEKILIEEIKLQTLEEIRNTFLKIWERN